MASFVRKSRATRSEAYVCKIPCKKVKINMINAATRNWMIKRWYEKVPVEKSSIPCEISFGITRFTPLLNNAKPIRLKIINLYGLSTENMFGLSGFSPGTSLVVLFAIFE